MAESIHSVEGHYAGTARMVNSYTTLGLQIFQQQCYARKEAAATGHHIRLHHKCWTNQTGGFGLLGP